MEISFFQRNILYQTSMQFQCPMTSHRFESGKFAKRPIENVRFGPEKTVLRNYANEGSGNFRFVNEYLRRGFVSSYLSLGE